MEGLGKYIIDLVFQPGSSLKLVPAINGSLCALLVLLAAMAYNDTVASIHIKILAFLSIGLMASVSWFVHEFRKAKALQEEEQKALSPAAAAGDKRISDSRPKED